MNSAPLHSEQLKAEAQRLGFLRCGLAPAHDLPPEVQARYAGWLARGAHADMRYLERHAEQRARPSLLVPGVRTIVSLALSYHPAGGPTQPALAWYAQGQDYHDVMKRRMRQLMEALGLTTGRCFADTAPVAEKYWAWRCGLGFVGRNTQVVIPRLGSAFFLGELFLQEEADRYDEPLTPSFFHHRCGTCRRCVEACPTRALGPEGGTLEAARCLSYLSIEHRGPLPSWAKPHFTPCFYGCDRCLRACPHLHAPQAAPLPEFLPSPQLLAMRPAQWQTLTPEQYRLLFKGSAVKRAKFDGLTRNIRAADEEP